MPSMEDAFDLAEQSRMEITVDYVNKKLIVPADLNVPAVKGDKDSRRLYFRVSKKPDDMDLSSATFEIKYCNALKETGRQMLTDVTADGDELTMSFLIPATFAKQSGKASIQLCAHSADKHWHISPYEVTVGEFIEVSEITEDDPKYDIVTQLLNAYTASGGNPGSLGGTSGMTQAQADARYVKKGDPITLTETQKAELKGAKGDTGAQGPKGDKGDPGAKGDTGVYAGTTVHQMSATDTTVTLNPNEVYVFPEMSSLTVNIGDQTNTTAGTINEYHFIFRSGSTATTLTLPEGVSTPEGMSVKASKTYEVSIVLGLALMQGWSNA